MDLGSEIRPEKTFSGSRIPDPGVKKAPDPGSGSATLPVRVRKERHSFPPRPSTIQKLLLRYVCEKNAILFHPSVHLNIFDNFLINFQTTTIRH